MGTLGAEFRKQFVLADDNKGTESNIDRDEREVVEARRSMVHILAQIQAGERTATSVTDSAERAERQREHRAMVAAHANEVADQRRAIETSVISSSQASDESDFSL